VSLVTSPAEACATLRRRISRGALGGTTKRSQRITLQVVQSLFGDVRPSGRVLRRSEAADAKRGSVRTFDSRACRAALAGLRGGRGHKRARV